MSLWDKIKDQTQSFIINLDTPISGFIEGALSCSQSIPENGTLNCASSEFSECNKRQQFTFIPLKIQISEPISLNLRNKIFYSLQKLKNSN